MPISRYNKAFGGKKGSAAKAKRRMKARYGDDKVFYATANKVKGLGQIKRAMDRRGG